MPSTKLSRDRNPVSQLQSDAEQNQLLQQAIEKQERLVESHLEMAKLFLQNRKPKIAMRRLKEIVSDFGDSDAAKEAKAMLKKL